jgi:predicted esterase
VRHPARFGGVAGLSGGLIGPPGTTWPTNGALAGTPIFLGCSDVDFHIPKERVIESAQVLNDLGAVVETILYPNMDHVINADELARVQKLVDGIQ